MAELTLGLDLGSASIGWALIDESSGEIHGMGVRVFPEGVDRDTKGGEVSKNENRRLARATRRQHRRRSKRKRQLRRALVEANLLPALALLPANDAERIRWEGDQFDEADPIALRRKALREKLQPWEIGRVLLHLNQRRGFLSNRKADREKKKENSEILKEISDLAAEMGERTLGQFLADARGERKEEFHKTRLRKRHTRRSMFEDEFERVWAEQRKHHPDLLTEPLRERLHRIIFFQRPIKPPSPGIVGRCELESRLPRCPRADRRAQRFRLFQEVNNLRVIDTSTREERPLTSGEREKLVKYLAGAKQRTFDQIRKHLFEQYESIHFNLERGGRDKLLGMTTDAALANKSLLGTDWKKLDEERKDRIVAAIIDDNEERLRYLLKQGGLNPERAQSLLENVDLDEGYSSYSLHAIRKLLPHIERGLPLTSRNPETPCALREAKYLMPWQLVPNQEKFLPQPPKLTNPLVQKALYEVRKVVNAILRELVHRDGHTVTNIRIEMAREVRGTSRQRQEQSIEMRAREKERAAAAERVREHGRKPTREAVNRYLLWREQGEVCVYSGRQIGIAQLFGGEVDTDHILPYPRSLDDSMMNKVVCFRSENSVGVNRLAKGDRTPYEWLAKSDPEKYEKVLQRAKHLPYPKLRRLYQETLDLADFFARQFVDTTYITTQVHQYVRCLGADVVCPKGQHTATLRHLWGLETILRDLEDSPAWVAAKELPPGEKNRLDHRHHALDALVIALTNRSRLQALADARRLTEAAEGVRLAEPWKDFRLSVQRALGSIRVSPRVSRRVSGALHEETVYGPTNKPGEQVVRKDLTALTCSMVANIRDRVVREIVTARLKEHGLEPGRGQDKIPADVWKEPLWMSAEKQVPIRRVRLIRREKTVTSIRGGSAFVKPGNTHHVCLFEWQEKGKVTRGGVFVSMIEASDRARRGEPIIQRTHPEHADARFLMSLSGNEVVLLKHDGVEELYTFVTAASTSQQMWFRHHTAGGKSSEKIGVVSKKPNTFDGRKVTVDPIGRVRWAND